MLVLDEAGIDRICEAFADVIDAKSPFTARHSRGVATYAGLIGEQLGFAAVDLRELHRAGMLHDIGKLGIPNTILDKPAKLTDEEFARIRLHPAYTESILAGIPAFARLRRRSPPPTTSASTAAATTAACPAGDLPVSARVLAVADVFEALTADRPYRSPMEPDEALAIAAQGSRPPRPVVRRGARRRRRDAPPSASPRRCAPGSDAHLCQSRRPSVVTSSPRLSAGGRRRLWR